MLADDLKVDIYSRLYEGDSPREISESMTISLKDVLKAQKEFKEAKKNDQLATILNTEEAILERVVESVKSDMIAIAPGNSELIEQEICLFVDSIKGAQLLESQLQVTAMAIVDKIRLKLFEEEISASVIASLVNSIAKLNSSFFAKGSSFVINNNTLLADGEVVRKFTDINQTD